MDLDQRPLQGLYTYTSGGWKTESGALEKQRDRRLVHTMYTRYAEQRYSWLVTDPGLLLGIGPVNILEICDEYTYTCIHLP